MCTCLILTSAFLFWLAHTHLSNEMCKKTWLLLFLLLVFQMPDPLLGLTRCFQRPKRSNVQESKIFTFPLATSLRNAEPTAWSHSWPHVHLTYGPAGGTTGLNISLFRSASSIHLLCLEIF